MQLEDQKDKYRQLKQRCHELEQVAEDRLERSQYWQSLCESTKKTGADSSKSHVTGTDKANYDATICGLESTIAEQVEKISEFDKQNLKLVSNLQMEQDTSNNLIMSLDAAQSKIEHLEERRTRFISKLEGRDHLIKELESVI